jgi:hypothetical protein
MAKIKLRIDALEVETFQTSGEAGTKGTVFGNDTLSHDTWCGAWGCDSTQLQIMCTCTVQPENTCDHSCAGTCNGVDDTCNWGCPGYTEDAHCPTNPGYQGC